MRRFPCRCCKMRRTETKRKLARSWSPGDFQLGVFFFFSLVSLSDLKPGKTHTHTFPYLQDTVISTLVAGTEGLSGSKSTIDAMLRKLLFILSMFFLLFPFYCGPAPFYERWRRIARNCVCASSARTGAKVPEREGLEDVMSHYSRLSVCIPLFLSPFPLFLLFSFCHTLPVGVFLSVSHSCSVLLTSV